MSWSLVVSCADDIGAEALRKTFARRKPKWTTYGLGAPADLQATHTQSIPGRGTLTQLAWQGELIGQLELQVPGIHNLSNAIAALIVARWCNVPFKQAVASLQSFSGTARRFELKGEVDGITIIDDYAHHPVEIAATLSAAFDVLKDSCGKIIAVMQPHRYSRLERLFVEFCKCFEDADHVIVAEVFAAGEQSKEGVNHHTLAEGIKQHGTEASVLNSPGSLASTVNKLAAPGDFVICLGAGSITKWANELPEKLAALRT